MVTPSPLQALSCCPFRHRDTETVTRGNIFLVFCLTGKALAQISFCLSCQLLAVHGSYRDEHEKKLASGV